MSSWQRNSFFVRIHVGNSANTPLFIISYLYSCITIFRWGIYFSFIIQIILRQKITYRIIGASFVSIFHTFRQFTCCIQDLDIQRITMYIIDKLQFRIRSLLILTICFFREISCIAFCIYVRTTLEITIIIIAIHMSIDSLNVSQSTIYSQETLFDTKTIFIIVIDNTRKRIVFTNHRGSLHIVILFASSISPFIVGQLDNRAVVSVTTWFTIYSKIYQLRNIVIFIIHKLLDSKTKLGSLRFSIFS